MMKAGNKKQAEEEIKRGNGDLMKAVRAEMRGSRKRKTA